MDTNNGCSSFAATGSNYTTATAYTASNQVKSTSVQSAAGTYIYDVAGNVINDGVNQYIYDLDGRICAVWSNYSSLGPMTQYVYDAEGRRVAKLKITSTASWPGTGLGNTCSVPVGANFTLTNQYLRGVSGDQDTELDGSGNWTHTNIYAGSGVQATYWNNAGTLELSYIFNDWLGTKRGQFSSTGSKQTSWQSDPFGDYMTPHGSGGDANEMHLTGKEHDTESGNDYFGARYYASPMGRFMSPDWSAKAEPVPYAKLGNPQTLNLYAFVGNNPVSHVDVDGHQTLGPDRFGCSEEQIGCDGRKDKPKQAQQPISLDTLITVLYHALGNLTPDPNAKPGAAGSAEDLSNARVATAEVILTKYRNNTAKPGMTVESDKFTPAEKKAFKDGNPAAVEALRLTTIAANVAYNGSNTANGALQYRARWNGDIAGALGRTSKSPGMPLTAHFGPFINEKGDQTWQVLGK